MHAVSKPDDRRCIRVTRAEPVPVLIRPKYKWIGVLGPLRYGIAYADIMLGTAVMATLCDIGDGVTLRVDPTWITEIPDAIAYHSGLHE